MTERDGVRGKGNGGPPPVLFEADRVAALLARDRADRVAEHRRQLAEADQAKGRFVDHEVLRLGPTPEQLRHAEYEPVVIEKHEGRTVRAVTTVRRSSVNRVKQLHDRGVLTDDTYPAVLWYQRAFEASGLDVTAAAASWGEHIAGPAAHGNMPRTQIAAEARRNFRFARGGTGDGFALPADMLPTFDNVVLAEMTISAAAKVARCRYANSVGVVRHVALLLLGRVGHLLPVRAVGAPGSAPVDESADPVVVSADPVDASQFDPRFLNDRGLMRPVWVIAKIVRGEPLSDEEDEA